MLVPYNVALFLALILTSKLNKRLDFLRVARAFDPVLSVRVPNTVELTLYNDGPIELQLEVIDEPPEHCEPTGNAAKLRVPPDDQRTLRYSIRPTERGSLPFRGTHVRCLAPLGLAWMQREFPTEEPARVYPNVQAVREFDLLRQKGRLNMIGVRRSRIRGMGTEFESLRDYHEDDFRKIDWKSSARHGRLIVRNHEVERNQSVILCVDVGRHMLAEVEGVRKLDHTLDAALMLMHAAEREGDLVGLLLFNDVIKRYIAPRKGRHQVAAILDTIHAVQAEPVQPNYLAAFSYLASRWKRRSLIVLFTDAENEDQARELAVALGQLKGRHLLMVVRVSDPELRSTMAREVDTPRELYARAATLWYVGDRRKAETALRESGIRSVEAEPQDLAGALVSAYLLVKEQSLL